MNESKIQISVLENSRLDSIESDSDHTDFLLWFRSMSFEEYNPDSKHDARNICIFSRKTQTYLALQTSRETGGIFSSDLFCGFRCSDPGRGLGGQT